METIDAINEAIKARNESKRTLSRAMGKSDNYIASVIEQSQRKGGGVYSATLANLADVCGYALALVPSDKVDDSMLVIDPPVK